jgi:hypothetical protein
MVPRRFMDQFRRGTEFGAFLGDEKLRCRDALVADLENSNVSTPSDTLKHDGSD